MIGAKVNELSRDNVPELNYPEMVADTKHVLHTLVFRQRDVPAAGGRWLRVGAMPYRTQDNRIESLVITFFDRTATKGLEVKLESTQSQVTELQASSNAQGK